MEMETQNFNEKAQLFNERSLYLTNIRQLRILGRQLGVPSPTTKSKKELIDYILNIIYGKVEVPIRNPFGRNPNDTEFDIEKFVKKAKINNEYTDYIYPQEDENQFFAKVASPETKYKLDEPVEAKTYHFENGKHYLKKMAFISSNKDIELSEAFVKKYGLNDLDTVEVNSINNLVNIISINGKKCENNFDKLSFCDCQISSGLNREFYFDSEEKLKLEIANLLQETAKTNIKVNIFAKNDYKNKNLQSIKYLEDDDNTIIYKKLMQFLTNCENDIINGEKILVIVEDFDYILNIISTFDTDVSVRMNNYLKNIFETITKLSNVILLLNLEKEFVY